METDFGTVYEGSYARDAFSDFVSGNPPRSKNNGSIWNKIGRFFKGLFSKENLAVAATSHGTLEIGELQLITAEYYASARAGIGIAGASIGAATLGAILMPTMIKEPEFNWTRGLDVPVDIPITTTDGGSEQRITLFRGVHGKHPGLANAYMGMAIPWGGFATAKQHNRGDNNSMFTSWTTSIDVANYSAFRRGPGGIILQQSFPISRLSFFDRHGEAEVQVFGPVFGAKKIRPWNGGTWTPYIK